MTRNTTNSGPAAQIFECDSEPIPPGAISQHKRDGEMYGDVSRRRFGLMAVSGFTVAALLAGVLIGRFLLP